MTLENHDNSTIDTPLGQRKKIVFRLVTLTLVYAIAELCAWIVVLFQCGGSDVLRKSMLATASNSADYAEVTPKFEVIHPYLGYVMHVNNPEYHVQGAQPFSVTDFGLYDAGSPIRHRSDDRIIVGITGGSVAHEFSVLSSDEFAAVLMRRYGDKEIEFVRLALPGFKQPQQLMSLNYVLALGGEFDLVINIDGFNEVALPGAENVEYGVFSAFPRSWHLRMVSGNDIQALRNIGLIAHLREQKRDLAIRFSAWRWSPTALLIWNFRDSMIDNRILRAQQELQAMDDLQRRFCSRGPSESFESDNEMYSRLAEIWADSSLQMHRLCNANGIEYYHFLQPSPDYPPAVALEETGDVEIAGGPSTASEGIPSRVRQGYPKLLARAEILGEGGVRFVDVTDAFDDFGGPVYVDFIHFNKSANDRFAERIGAEIVDATPQDSSPQ